MMLGTQGSGGVVAFSGSEAWTRRRGSSHIVVESTFIPEMQALNKKQGQQHRRQSKAREKEIGIQETRRRNEYHGNDNIFTRNKIEPDRMNMDSDKDNQSGHHNIFNFHQEDVDYSTMDENISFRNSDTDDRHDPGTDEENQENPPSIPDWSLMPSFSPSSIPSSGPTLSDSQLPSMVPTYVPSKSPSFYPTPLVSESPTLDSSEIQSYSPTQLHFPSDSPSLTSQPSYQYKPSVVPSAISSVTPSAVPSAIPSSVPTQLYIPSNSPTLSSQPSYQYEPSGVPTTVSSDSPTTYPSYLPSSAPTQSQIPSDSPSTTSQPSYSPQPSYQYSPSNIPSKEPTKISSDVPSGSPSEDPSRQPSVKPSGTPSSLPTEVSSNIPTTYPSKSPSSAPTQSHIPSDSPSTTSQPSYSPQPSYQYSPSNIPSKEPTKISSDAPSGSPSEDPSRQPSVKPSGTPSSAPTEVSSDSPTTYPSYLPSSAPTQSQIPSDSPSTTSQPSYSPQPSYKYKPSATPSTSSITSSPTISCNETETGTFGNVAGTSKLVSFAYEMETDPSFGISITLDILPALELSTSNMLMKTMFASCRVDSRRRRIELDDSMHIRSLIYHHRHLEELAGMSSQPADLVRDDLQCAGEPGVGNECTVIEGRLTIYSDGEFSDQETALIEAMKSGMTNGDLLSAHEAIVKLTYVDIASLTLVSTNSDDDDDVATRTIIGGTDDEDDTGNSLWDSTVFAGVITWGSVVAIASVVGRFMTNRRRTYIDKQGDVAAWREVDSREGSIPSMMESGNHGTPTLELTPSPDPSPEKSSDQKVSITNSPTTAGINTNMAVLSDVSSITLSTDKSAGLAVYYNHDQQRVTETPESAFSGIVHRCFDFFDSILDGTNKDKLDINIVDDDDISELS